MNKKYIDFVLGKKGGSAVVPKEVTAALKKSAPKSSEKAPEKVPEAEKKAPEAKKKPVLNISRKEVPILAVKKEETPKKAPEAPKRVIKAPEKMAKVIDRPKKISEDVQFGVVEDYHPKFIKTEVSKRPLGAKKAVSKKPAVAPKPVPAAKPIAKPAAVKSTGVKSSYRSRTTAFVNTNKIEKRPLSKNVYAKAPVITKEKEVEKPVRIIEKPEKDSKAGLIIAIILTIILGAAAGTVAFLLLPK